MKPVFAFVFGAVLTGTLAFPAEAAKPNLLIVTVDDMSCDSVGVFGCELEGTTPNIDAFAATGLRYHYAHVQVGNCYPSRNVMFSGRYPHNTGVEGFYPVRDPDYPHLVDLMKSGGYFVGIRGKVSHSTPFQPYGWDADLTEIDGEKQHLKDIESYYRSTKRGIELAKQSEQPFCLNVNISDPHKPFYAMGKQGAVVDDPHVPSRVFTPEEVPIPGFLFDHPDVRLELAHYYSSVRRADDCFGAIIKALRESGQEDETVVMFLSDHGMPLPFAKTALWHHSTRTPWIVRWPGVTRPGTVDKQHMISAVDMLPTLLDIAGLDHPDGFDGRTFEPTLRGKLQSDREMVFKVYNENSGANRSPMRSVQSKQYGYLFNPWSDGQRVFRTATTGTLSFRAMQKVASSDERIAARLELFQHGVSEEFYDYQRDPDALNNLIDDPNYAAEIAKHRARLRAFMQTTGDHALKAFENRDDPRQVSAYVDAKQAEADARRASRRKGNSKPKPNPRLFQMETSADAKAGDSFDVTITHQIPRKLGVQKFHVTLKGPQGKRIKRVVESASGKGKLSVSFAIPTDLVGKQISIAAFVGDEFDVNLMHRTANKIPVTE